MDSFLPKKAYIIAVDMGYGHQRAAYPLLKFAAVPGEWKMKEPVIISANKYPGIPRKDNFVWNGTRKVYEWLSRAYGFPFLGKRIFHLMDYFQKIEPFYPRRNLSKPTLQAKQIYRMIKNGVGNHLIKILNKEPLPIICTFPMVAFMAEEHGYKGKIYCLCTDTDVSRFWATPYNPGKSRVIYLAPTVRVEERLKLYGIRPERIVVTGFPLPEEALGDTNSLDVLKKSLSRRLSKLDPRGVYRKKYKDILSIYFGQESVALALPGKPLEITFAVGGAGAQWDIGVAILKSLREKIKEGAVKLNLVAGSSKKIRNKFERALKKFRLAGFRGKNLEIIYDPDKFKYFKKFNEALVNTDILWTKPSELSFYAGLGLPIIMTPPLGSQEEYNKNWLHMVGAGFEQYDPRYSNEWLFDWLSSGWLAEAAMDGFLNAPKRAIRHIEDLVLRGKKTEIEDIHFV